MPRIRIEWKLSDLDLTSLRTTLSMVRRGLGSSSAARFEVKSRDLDGLEEECRPQGGHHIGTARMGTTEKEGVVDSWGALWEARNTYLVGSAVFPRSGAANPTLMLVALALRTSDRLIAELRRG